MNLPCSEPAHEKRRLVALRDLIASYNRPLVRYFERRVTSTHDVPDLVQEVFLRLSRLSDPSDLREPASFIFVTAANVLRDDARRKEVRGHKLTDALGETDIEGTDFTPDRVFEGREAALRIRRALSELPERTRDVFVLRLLEGWKMADVAQSLGISTRAAEKHQARALAHVTAQLEDWRRG